MGNYLALFAAGDVSILTYPKPSSFTRSSPNRRKGATSPGAVFPPFNAMKYPTLSLTAPLALVLSTGSLSASLFPQLDSYTGGAGSSEIVVHDRFQQSLYNVYGTRGSNGGVEILDFADPTNLTQSGLVDMSVINGLTVGSISSVSADPLGRGFGVATFIPLNSGTDKGRVVFFDPSTKAVLHSVEVGYHPDMVRFSKDGTQIFVANEGEPLSEGSNHFDRAGSVSVIDLSTIASKFDVAGLGSGQVADYDFSDANLAPGVSLNGLRINPSNAAPGNQFKDIEPEYITQSGNKLYVSLQENNALAELDLASGQWTAIGSLGTIEKLIDASDRDSAINGGINIDDLIHGLPMPDTIASYTVGGKTYVLTANEGDTRPPDFVASGHPLVTDESRFADLGTGGRPALDPAVDAALDALYGGNAQASGALGRLTISLTDGNLDADPDIEQPTAFGTRSFSIWDASDFSLVYDSGSDFENLTKTLVPGLFNSDGTLSSFDTRSDNKGPEPEGITIGRAYGRNLAFIGLERVGGVMVYDITDPNAPTFFDYFNTGERGAEGMAFITAADSPTGKPLLLVGYEVSGKVGVYTVVPEAGSVPAGLAVLGLAFGVWRRRVRA